MKRVLISGYYGFGNTGDEAILEALAVEFKRQEIELSVLSASPEESKNRYGITAYSRFRLGQAARAIRNCNGLISGGGSLFQDVTSSGSLYYYIGIVMLALALRREVFVYSQGIGPINWKFNRKLLAAALNRVSAISIRDRDSYDELLRLGVKTPASVTADPVFLLEPAGVERGVKILDESGLDTEKGGQMIGFAVRPWGDRERASENFARAADKIIEEIGAKLVFFPFHHPQDLDFTFEIIKKMKNKPYIVDKQYLPSEVMAAMGLMNINIGVRLHSLIFSACMGVPMIGISYDPKIKGFLNSMGTEPVCDYEDLQWEKIKESILYINSNRAFVLETISKKTGENRSIAQDSLERLVGELKR